MKGDKTNYFICLLLLLLVVKNATIEALNANTSADTSKRKLESVTETCVTGGRCLKVYKATTALTSNEAYESCKSKGEEFATIDSAEEHQAVWDTGQCPIYHFNMKQFGGVGSPWQYKDMNGNLHSYSSYRNWGSGQPDGGDQQCVVIYNDNKWHDVGCTWVGTQCYVCLGTTAGGGGDPHFAAFGGIFFSWQGHCDAILARITGGSSNNDDDDDTTKTGLEIQVRMRKVRNWSSIDVVAVKAGRHVLEIGSEEGKLLLNGSEVDSVDEDSLIVSLTRLKKRTVSYRFVFDGDKNLDVEVNTRSRMIFVSLSGNYPEDTIGLVGSPRRPGLFARGGARDTTGKDVNEFVESWQVRDDDPQLFLTTRAPQFPAKCLYSMGEVRESDAAAVGRSSRSRHDRRRRLKEIRGAVTVEEANEACATHDPGPLKTFCVEDTIATGDFESAQDMFYG